MQNKMLEQTLGIKSVLQTGLTLNSDQNLLEVQTSPRVVWQLSQATSSSV